VHPGATSPKKLYVLAWLDFDVIKAGELIALTALELAGPGETSTAKEPFL
jgi:hypothetical protein